MNFFLLSIGSWSFTRRKSSNLKAKQKRKKTIHKNISKWQTRHFQMCDSNQTDYI